ncbi:MAG: DNA polymerase III subunit chi [Duodenibacillus sp.]|nr:DNA polymerase III subunit chi [Duodenibacillus sp.]
MQQIDYHYNVKIDVKIYACRLIKKVRGMGKSVAVWSRNRRFLEVLYDDLWRFEDLAFIPHAWARTALADECNIIFSDNLDELPATDVIILMDSYVPENIAEALGRFERGVDIVSVRPNDLKAGRVRYKAYRDAGIPLKAYDRGSP